MVSSAVKVDVKNELGANIKSRGGLMTPEHVAEGFFRLLTQCDSGAAMAVNKVRGSLNHTELFSGICELE